MTRIFVDHLGRVQRVRMTSDEVARCAKYWVAVVAVSVVSLIAMSVAAGVM